MGWESKTLRMLTKLAYAEKWLILGSLVGAASGFFVMLFFIMLKYVVSWSGSVIGAGPAEIGGAEVDLSALVISGGFDRVRLYLLIVAGAALSGLIVYSLAPEAEGHGTDAAVAAFHKRAAIIPFRVPVVKLIASAVAIGTGSSGGVEGPSVQMGAGIGSSLAKLFRMTIHDRRIMLTSGIAGALSAMFRAPIGSSFFAVEVLYKRDLEASAFMPSIVSSIVSYTVTASYFKYSPLLPTIPVDIAKVYTPDALLLLAGLGVFVAPFSYLYVKAFTGAKRAFDRLGERLGSNYPKPVIGALLAGVLIVFFPIASGSGRGVLSLVIEGRIVDYISPYTRFAPLWLVLILLAIVKIVATSLSIGSGASGGVFAPGLLTGALLGLSYYHLATPHTADLSPHLFAYIGMAAFFGAAAKVPLATSIMVGEMGGNYLLIAPTLIAAFIAREIVGDESIYESQIPRRLHKEAVTAEGLLVIVKNLGEKIALRAIDIVDVSYKPLPITATLKDAIELMAKERGKVIPVVDENGRVVGVLDPEDLEAIIEELGGDLSARLNIVKLRVPPLIDMNATIEQALEEMVAHATDYAIVVTPDGRYIGVITLDDISSALAHILVERREHTAEYVRSTTLQAQG